MIALGSRLVVVGKACSGIISVVSQAPEQDERLTHVFREYIIFEYLHCRIDYD